VDPGGHLEMWGFSEWQEAIVMAPSVAETKV
jgi:hypothetical protein